MRPKNHIPPCWLQDPERPRGLRQLRRIDPTVDLHYIGNDQWVLGSVKSNSVRRNIAGSIKRRLERAGARTAEQYRMTVLHYHGFGYIECYSTEAYQNGAILPDLREREFRYRHGREEAYQTAAGRSKWRKDPEESVDEIITSVQEREASVGDIVMGREQFEPMPGVDPGGALRA